MTRPLEARGAPARPVTPAEFFTSLCPKVLQLQAPLCARLGGRYAFSLFGAGGGAWTIDYPSALVHDGAAAEAELYVEMDAADFSALLRGALDVDAAASAGRVRIVGDARLFSHLAAVLAPPQ